MKKKEFGSDFHLCQDIKWQVKKEKFFDRKKSSFFLFGRSALFAIKITNGKQFICQLSTVKK